MSIFDAAYGTTFATLAILHQREGREMTDEDWDRFAEEALTIANQAVLYERIQREGAVSGDS